MLPLLGLFTGPICLLSQRNNNSLSSALLLQDCCATILDLKPYLQKKQLPIQLHSFKTLIEEEKETPPITILCWIGNFKVSTTAKRVAAKTTEKFIMTP